MPFFVKALLHLYHLSACICALSRVGTVRVGARDDGLYSPPVVSEFLPQHGSICHDNGLYSPRLFRCSFRTKGAFKTWLQLSTWLQRGLQNMALIIMIMDGTLPFGFGVPSEIWLQSSNFGAVGTAQHFRLLLFDLWNPILGLKTM